MLKDFDKADFKTWLAQAIEDYLAWMKSSGYSASTICSHKRLIFHFKDFAIKFNLKAEEIFTYDALKAFEKHCPLYLAGCSVRGFSRYLARKNVIANKILKPRDALPDVYEDYLCFLKINRQADGATIGAIVRILAALNSYLNARDIALCHLRIEHIDEFLVKLNNGLMPATCRHNRSYLRGFLKYLFLNRKITKRDLSALVMGPVNFANLNPPKFFTPEEIKKIFSIPTTYAARELRCMAMVHLAYSLGLRPKEIAMICLDDVCFAKREICIAQRKSLNPITLPLPEAAVKAIAAYVIGARPKTDLRALFVTLFVPFRPLTPASVSHDITLHIQKVNPNATGYWLRHTYAQNMLESDASIFEVKQMMGHDSLDTTRKYLFIHTKLMRKVLFDETI